MTKHITYLEPVIREVMMTKAVTRNDYKKLIFEIWEKEGLHLTPEQEQLISQLTPPESITRCARKIWETGDLLPNQTTRVTRRKRQQEIKSEMTYIYDDQGNKYQTTVNRGYYR